MKSWHVLTMLIILAGGYWLGKKFPSALGSLPVVGSYLK